MFGLASRLAALGKRPCASGSLVRLLPPHLHMVVAIILQKLAP